MADRRIEKNPATARPGGVASKRRTPRRLLIPDASPVLIIRADGTTEEEDPYTTAQAAKIIWKGQAKRNTRRTAVHK